MIHERRGGLASFMLAWMRGKGPPRERRRRRHHSINNLGGGGGGGGGGGCTRCVAARAQKKRRRRGGAKKFHVLLLLPPPFSFLGLLRTLETTLSGLGRAPLLPLPSLPTRRRFNSSSYEREGGGERREVVTPKKVGSGEKEEGGENGTFDFIFAERRRREWFRVPPPYLPPCERAGKGEGGRGKCLLSASEGGGEKSRRGSLDCGRRKRRERGGIEGLSKKSEEGRERKRGRREMIRYFGQKKESRIKKKRGGGVECKGRVQFQLTVRRKKKRKEFGQEKKSVASSRSLRWRGVFIENGGGSFCSLVVVVALPATFALCTSSLCSLANNWGFIGQKDPTKHTLPPGGA